MFDMKKQIESNVDMRKLTLRTFYKHFSYFGKTHKFLSFAFSIFRVFKLVAKQ